MKYNFLDKNIEIENLNLPSSEKINNFLLKNYEADIIKAINFIKTDEKFLYVHGFMGTGKRQFINYISEFTSNEVIKLEYYCKAATVCDDILLYFSNIIEKFLTTSSVNINTKITTLNVKLKQQITTNNIPFIIILHSFDEILEENLNVVKDFFSDIIQEENIKLIISTKAMLPSVLNNVEVDKKIFLKSLKQDIFKEFLNSNNISPTETIINDFYKYTRGYYYYLALSIKIIQAMKINLTEFLDKFNKSGMTFDSYLGFTYINLLPAAIRNFFWFLRTIRHGISINALIELELYDEFSINYLKTNLMVFENDEILYVQDYFIQEIDISIPRNTQIKLHKYIADLYDKQLKKTIKERTIFLSRQAMRAEIEYHNTCIKDLASNSTPKKQTDKIDSQTTLSKEVTTLEPPLLSKLEKTKKLIQEKKYTEAIEAYNLLLSDEKIDLITVVEARLQLARIYKLIEENKLSLHYYELVEIYYKQHNENINLNYLYYEMTDIFYKMYKTDRAIDTIKKVIYSVDTPQSLMVSACTLLGNIYSDTKNSDDAYKYYQKALESLDENVDKEVLVDLYFKFALANDDIGNFSVAFEYYNKCILQDSNTYKALAYSNMASCYMENQNHDDALSCFLKAYEIEKNSNNYEGIYYNASHIAKLYVMKKSKKALNFLLEAKKSAEFLNANFYILEAEIALGDYYYNNPQTMQEALVEYLKAKKIAETLPHDVDMSKIVQRILDMEHRINKKVFLEIKEKYEK